MILTNQNVLGNLMWIIRANPPRSSRPFLIHAVSRFSTLVSSSTFPASSSHSSLHTGDRRSLTRVSHSVHSFYTYLQPSLRRALGANHFIVDIRYPQPSRSQESQHPKCSQNPSPRWRRSPSPSLSPPSPGRTSRR